MNVWRLPLVALLLLSCSLAGAQESRTDEQLAQKYFMLGKELYDRSDYEGALAQFKQSFKYSKMPALQFNMARCYESLGRLSLAIDSLEKFLASKPANAAVIQSRIDNLRRRLAKEEPLAKEIGKVQPKADKPKADKPKADKPKADKPKADKPKADKPKIIEPAQPLASRPMKIAGWTLVGVGGAALVTGIVLGALASGKASDLEQAAERHEPWSDELMDEENAGESMDLGMVVSLIAGGALAATGAVLLVLDSRSGSAERRAWISPVITPTGAAVSGTLRF